MTDRLLGETKHMLGPDIDGLVKIFYPEKTQFGDFKCRFTIEVIKYFFEHSSCGVDSVQAICLALERIGTEVAILRAREGLEPHVHLFPELRQQELR
jgi:hypothetical protein